MAAMRKACAAAVAVVLAACSPVKVPPPPPAGLMVLELGEGSGTVRVRNDPSGCGVECMGMWGAGEAIEIEAVPGLDSSFDGWEGECRGMGPCWLPLDRARLVGAKFRFAGYEWARDVESSAARTPMAARGSLAIDPASGAVIAGVRDRVATYSSSGEPAWSVQPPSGGRFDRVSVDASGDVSVIGRFSAASAELKGSAFIARYTSAGALRFRVAIPGAPRAIATAGDGRVAVAGHFEGAIEVGAKKLVSRGARDAFVAMFSADGAPLWAEASGGAGDDGAVAVTMSGDGGIARSSDRVVLAGVLDDGASDARLFARAYSIDGEPLWLREASTHERAEVSDLAATGSSIIAAGRFDGALAIGKQRVVSAGGSDAFVMALSAIDGTPLWSERFGGPHDDAARGVATSPLGEIVVTGEFTGEADFGDRHLVSTGYPEMTQATPPSSDAFVLALMGRGKVRNAMRFGTSGADAGDAIAARGDAVIWLARFAALRLTRPTDDLAVGVSEASPGWRVAKLAL